MFCLLYVGYQKSHKVHSYFCRVNNNGNSDLICNVYIVVYVRPFVLEHGASSQCEYINMDSLMDDESVMLLL